MAKASLFYTVKKGDTLSEIAQLNGTTPEKLSKINGIDNINQIIEGQRIALSAKAVCKVTVLLIDKDHNPIPDAKIRLEYNGKSKILTSGPCGIVPSIITKSPKDIVRISIGRPDGSWELLQVAPSDWGNKLVTCKSKATRYEGETMEHPKDAKGNPIRDPKETDKKPVKPPEQPETTEAKGKPHSNYGDGKGQKSEQTKNKKGLPVQKVTNDQVKLDFIKGYTGEKITEDDYKNAAKSIGCEVAVIKAVAEVESRGEPFDGKKRPTILFERHKFAEHTNPPGKYNKINPDISSAEPYMSATKENIKLAAKGKLNSHDLYGNSYPRLAKAYALDKNAALKSCSWGKFQILGSNFKAAGHKTLLSFIEAMCRSEKEHLKAFVSFVNSNKKLKKAAIDKNWVIFAKNYNGKEYWKNKYDIKMKEAYLRHAK